MKISNKAIKEILFNHPDWKCIRSDIPKEVIAVLDKRLSALLEIHGVVMIKFLFQAMIEDVSKKFKVKDEKGAKLIIKLLQTYESNFIRKKSNFITP